jgi:hypothetical protein
MATNAKSNVTSMPKKSVLKPTKDQAPAIIRAFLAGERSDKAIHACLCVCAEQVAKDHNTIALLKQVVIPVLGYEAKPGSLDRKTITLNYIRDVMLLDVDKDALSVKFRLPASEYDREWFDRIKATPWGSSVKVVKDFSDQFETVIGQSATGLLMGALTWSDLRERYAPAVLARISTELNKPKVQKKVSERLSKLGKPEFDVAAINAAYLGNTAPASMVQA